MKPGEFLLAALLGFASLSAPRAAAGEMADVTREALQSGHFAEGEAKLSERLAANPGDDEATLGLGMIRFAEAVERFGEAQYRFGLRTVPMGAPVGLAFRLLPENPKPEPIDYEAQRATLRALLDDLVRVDSTLTAMGDGPAKIELDLDAIQFHFDGGSGADPRQTLGALIHGLSTPRPLGAPVGGAPPVEKFDAVFDHADGLWLRAYTHLISAALEFALAYDWKDSFDRYARLFYDGARRAEPYEIPSRKPTFMQGEDQILDLVGFLHSIHWRLQEPDRVRASREHFKAVVALNRQMWPIISARVGDDRNWIAGPRQKNAAIQPTTEAQIRAWLADVELFDAVLDGKQLVPHWRYGWGIDFRKFFEEPRDFDLVYWITGPGAAPYLRPGPTIERQQWTEMQRAFNGSFLTYLVWFN
jgi:hypothetical protein